MFIENKTDPVLNKVFLKGLLIRADKKSEEEEREKAREEKGREIQEALKKKIDEAKHKSKDLGHAVSDKLHDLKDTAFKVKDKVTQKAKDAKDWIADKVGLADKEKDDNN